MGRHPRHTREVVNTCLPLRAQIARMEKAGIRPRWTDADIRNVKKLIELVWPSESKGQAA